MKIRTLVILFLALSVPSATWAQRGRGRISFSPSADPQEQNPVLRKLSPGLRDVVRSQSLLIGKNADGSIVLENAQVDTAFLTNVQEVQDASDRVDQLIVSYAGSTRPTDDELKASGLTLVENYTEGEFLVVTPAALRPQVQGVNRAVGILHSEISTLAASDKVRYIDANFIMRVPEPGPTAILSADEVQQLTINASDAELQRLWGIRKSEAPRVQNTTNPEDIIVAVIDSGVDYNHPDLRQNMWVNTREQNGRAGVDDDNNGVVDDVFGASFFEGQTSGNPMDSFGHGTHCAGTIAAVSNGTGVVGMAQTKIMAIKFLGAPGTGGRTSDAIKSIDYARLNGAHVMSNSWGSSGNVPVVIDQAIRRARDAGILFVAAAGNANSNNDTRPNSPSNSNQDNVIAVGSYDFRNGRSGFSNFGLRTVDIGAPGGTVSNDQSEDILSTFPGNRYAFMQGTSMATPHVSGGAALILGHPDYANASFATVKSLLLKNARPNSQLAQFWPQGRELDVSFLAGSPGGGNPPPGGGDRTDGGGGNNGGGNGGGSPGTLPETDSEGQFYFSRAQRFASDQVLVKREIRLTQRAKIHMRASASATMDAQPATFANSIYIAGQVQKSSIRLATTTLRNHYVPFGTSFSTTLEPGTYTIEWKIQVRGSVQIRGGGALDLQAFALSE